MKTPTSKRPLIATVVYGSFIAGAVGLFLFGLAISLADAWEGYEISRDPSCHAARTAAPVVGACAWEKLVLLKASIREIGSRGGTTAQPFVVVELPDGAQASLDIDYDLYDDLRPHEFDDVHLSGDDLYGLVRAGRVVWIVRHDEESDTSASPWGRFQHDGVPLIAGSVACVFVFAMRSAMRDAAERAKKAVA